jgi:16S rRNA G1207 methylase RsmC
MTQRRDEVEWWVECWHWENPPYRWEKTAAYPNAQEALEEARRALKRHGGRWRVVRITKALMQEIT